MEKFSLTTNGYNTSEVDKTLSRIKAEYEQKIKEQKEELAVKQKYFNKELNLKKEHISTLEKRIETLQELLKRFIDREETATNIIDASNNLKKLEAQRFKLLYQKWGKFLTQLQSKVVPYISLDELLSLSHDFQYALQVVVEEKQAQLENKNESTLNQILIRMGGNPKATKQVVARKYTAKIGQNRVEETFVEQQITASKISQAEMFLNGEGIEIPKSLGIGKELLVTTKTKKPKKAKEFSMEEALVPKESLSEIMTVFKLDE